MRARMPDLRRLAGDAAGVIAAAVKLCEVCWQSASLKEPLGMPSIFETASTSSAIPITFVTKANWPAIKEGLSTEARNFAEANVYGAKPGSCLILPAADGRIAQVLFGIEDDDARHRDPFRPGALPGLLPAGTYRFANAPHDIRLAALAFALGSYRFGRYRKSESPDVRLVPPDGVDAAELNRLAEAAALARDLVNTPSNDMGPEELEAAAKQVAGRFGARFTSIVGDDLLQQNFPLVHAVGRASTRAPRLIELVWGDASHPKVTLVGKGVCFDTGGISIKPADGMEDMKWDMGGAAAVTGVMHALAGRKAKVNAIGVLGLVENMPDGNAQRPGDVVSSMSGQTIEVINTDAEGRLILADALTRAAELKPALTLDFATLTGAARIAMGPFVIPFWTPDDKLAGQIEAASKAVADPLWRLPLTEAYRDALDSDIADLKNDPDGWAQAGATTAALFLQRFAPSGDEVGPWAHFDVFAWNPKGYPVGAEVQAIRAAFAMLRARFSR